MNGQASDRTAGVPTPLLELNGLAIDAQGQSDPRIIVSGLTLSVSAGESLGIVGESGSGKSMTARAVLGLLPRGVSAHGSIRLEGRELIGLKERELTAIRGTKVGLVFQDPFTMLNPLLRTRHHITEALRDGKGRRLRGAGARQEAVRRLAEVGIEDPAVADRYPFELSGGMRQRVGIAAALARDPELLIADEPTTALDVTTQREILALLKSLQRSRGMALVLITHDLRVAFSMCNRICVLYAGCQLEHGPAPQIEADPSHPYTLGLLLSEPPAAYRVATLDAIPGSVARPDEVTGRCAFSTRCRWTTDACTSAAPPLRSVAGDVTSACIRIEEIRPEIRVMRKPGARGSAEVEAVASATETLLVARDIHKTFAGGPGAPNVHAVRGVSIAVAPGESVGIVGESGSGKTTVARCLVGLETATSGVVELDGIDASDLSNLSAADRRRVRGMIQMAFQDPYSSLNPVRTVGATLREAFAVKDGGGDDLDKRIAEMLERVGLRPEYASRKPASLSGGERQRVAIARALAVQPKLLVCDEPVSALDVSVQAQVLNLLRDVREQSRLAYLFITHDLAVVRQIADRVYVMHNGVVVEEGAVDEVLDRPGHEYTRRLVASIPRADSDWIQSDGPAVAQLPR